MNKDTQKIALFDLDGSLADFEGAMRRDLEALRAPSEPAITDGMNLHDLEDNPHIQSRMHLIKSKPGWWSSLARIEHGFEILREAQRIGFHIDILTKAPSKTPRAWTEKVEWCQAQQELAEADIHLTMNKGLVYGTMLFDDYPRYMDMWLASRPRGLGIMPATPDNAGYSHPNVIRWNGSNFWEVSQVMQIAYDRRPYEELLIKYHA